MIEDNKFDKPNSQSNQSFNQENMKILDTIYLLAINQETKK